MHLLLCMMVKKKAYIIIEGDFVQEYRMAIISKCLQLSIMFFPVLLWIYYLCIQCFISFPDGSFIGFSIFIDLCLFCTILFGNSFIKLSYLEDSDEILFIIQKPNYKIFIKNIFLFFPVLLCVFSSILTFFLIYTLLQIFYMYVDKRHFTMMERVVFSIENKIKRKNKKEETILA